MGVSAIIAIVSAVYTYTEMEKAQAKAHEAQAKRDAEADAAKGSIIPTELSASPLFIVYGTRLVGGVRSYNKILNNLNGGMPPAGSEFFPIGASKMRVDVSPVYNTEPLQYRELVEGPDYDYYVALIAPVGTRLMGYNKTAILDQYSCNHADSTGVYDGSTKLSSDPAGDIGVWRGQERHEYLLMQQAFAAGGVTRVLGIKVDSKPVSHPDFSGGVDEDKSLVALGQHTYNRTTAMGTVMVHPSGSVACPLAYHNDAERSNATFEGIGYLTAGIWLNRDQPQYGGVPDIQPIVNGKGIFSVENNAGVYALSANRTFSRNTPRIILDYLMDTTYGLSCSLDEIDLMSFYEAQQLGDRIVYREPDWAAGTYSGAVDYTKGALSVPGFKLKTDMLNKYLELGPAYIRHIRGIEAAMYHTGEELYVDSNPNSGNKQLLADTYLSSLEGRTVKLFETDLAVDTGAPVRDNLQKILNAMPFSSLVWSAGQWRLRAYYPKLWSEYTQFAIGDIVQRQDGNGFDLYRANTPVNGLWNPAQWNTDVVAAYVTDDDIVMSTPVSVLWPDSQVRLNSCTVRFLNEAKDYSNDSVSWPPRESATNINIEGHIYSQSDAQHLIYLAEDSNITLEADLFVDGITNLYQARAIAEQKVRLSRAHIIYSMQLTQRLAGLEPGDVIRIQSDMNHIDALVLLEKTTPTQSGQIDISGYYVDARLLAWNNQDAGSGKEIVTTFNTLSTSPIGQASSLRLETYTNGVANKLTWDFAIDSRVTKYKVKRTRVPIALCDVYTVWEDVGITSTNWLELPFENATYTFAVVSITTGGLAASDTNRFIRWPKLEVGDIPRLLSNPNIDRNNISVIRIDLYKRTYPGDTIVPSVPVTAVYDFSTNRMDTIDGLWSRVEPTGDGILYHTSVMLPYQAGSILITGWSTPAVVSYGAKIYSISVSPNTLVISRDDAGQNYGFTYANGAVSVLNYGNNISDSDLVNFSIVSENCTATIDNVISSPEKGFFNVTAMPDSIQEGSLHITVEISDGTNIVHTETRLVRVVAVQVGYIRDMTAPPIPDIPTINTTFNSILLSYAVTPTYVAGHGHDYTKVFIAQGHNAVFAAASEKQHFSGASTSITVVPVSGALADREFTVFFKNRSSDAVDSVETVGQNITISQINTADIAANAIDAALLAVSLQTSLETTATNASDALASANTANSLLAEIASDDLLTPDEKPSVILSKETILGEQTSLTDQATAYGITTAKTTYTDAVTALTTYLATLTTPVLWSTLTGNTTIVGTTFRAKFKDVYIAKQALLDAIVAAAKVLADNAQTTASDALSGLTSKLNNNAVNTLTGTVALQTSSFAGGDGVAVLSTGIVAKKANNTTFALNTDGTVTIGGSLAAATGYFAGYLRAGAAIVENITMGSLDGGVTYGSIDVGAGGSIYGGKTAYSSTGAGFWLGYDGTDHKLNIGSSNNFVKWDGTSLSIQGTLQSSNFSTGTAGWKLDNAGNIEVNSGTFRGTLDVKSAVSGARLEVKNNVIKVFDSAGTLRVQIGDLTA